MIELTGKLPKYSRNTGNLIDPRFNIDGFNPQRDYPKRTYAETYAITWTSKKEMGFELPTGGGAIMHEGENIMYFARKEQCLALGTQLKTDLKPKIKDYTIYLIIFYLWFQVCLKLCSKCKTLFFSCKVHYIFSFVHNRPTTSG